MKVKELERRVRITELRAVPMEGEERSRKVGGMAVVYDQWTTIGTWYREKILPGALTEALTGSDVRLLFNHDHNHLLARTKSGTLKLEDRADGLYFEAELPESREDIIEMIERGDLDECSFAFRVSRDNWRFTYDNSDLDLDERVIEEISDIVDVTVATYGAYPQTEVGLRTHEAAKEEYEKEIAKRIDHKHKEESRQRLLALHSYNL